MRDELWIFWSVLASCSRNEVCRLTKVLVGMGCILLGQKVEILSIVEYKVCEFGKGISLNDVRMFL